MNRPSGCLLSHADLQHLTPAQPRRFHRASKTRSSPNCAPAVPPRPARSAQAAQAERFGAELAPDDVVDVDCSNGHIPRPTGPGLAIEINEEAVRHAAQTGHQWRSPTLRHTDGGRAEW